MPFKPIYAFTNTMKGKNIRFKRAGQLPNLTRAAPFLSVLARTSGKIPLNIPLLLIIPPRSRFTWMT